MHYQFIDLRQWPGAVSGHRKG